MRRLITQRNIDERKAQLADGEEDNFPNGNTTMHSFVTDKKLRNNEEMCVRNPDGSFVISVDDIVGSLPSEAAAAQMKAKCCRAMFSISKENIAKIFRVHGEGIKIFQAAAAADIGLGTDNDPPFGFDMQNPEDGYPCMNLLPDGRCSVHESGKPYQCDIFPKQLSHLGADFGAEITNCSVTFDDDGNKLTACDGCGAFTPE